MHVLLNSHALTILFINFSSDSRSLFGDHLLSWLLGLYLLVSETKPSGICMLYDNVVSKFFFFVLFEMFHLSLFWNGKLLGNFGSILMCISFSYKNSGFYHEFN